MFNVLDENGEVKKYYGLPILPSPGKIDLYPHYENQIDENGEIIKGSSVPVHKKEWKFSYMEFGDISCENPICTCEGPGSDCAQNGACPKVDSFQQGPPCEDSECLDWIFQIGPRLMKSTSSLI